VALTTGARLGPYEITARIGVGGMGEVYRATDTNLKRAVAIKVLPESVAGDSDRLARFQREAEVLASLNHPHIAAIYGLERSNGTTALVMELVEGPTLADRIAEGPIPLNETVPLSRQIAEALEAAHEQGIIHRDLKPANIKVRSDGTVKVLDFGLAKAMEPAAVSSPGVSQSPTITTPAMTQAGIVLGTAAYMSPEQARGQVADKRSDVWAFGCVLFEMLTGTRAFGGDGMSDTLASVLRSDPEWSRLPRDVPREMHALIRRCLAKDRRQRVSDMSTAKFVLTELADPSTPQAVRGDAGATTASPGSRWKQILPAVATVAVTAIGVTVAVWTLRSTPSPPVVVRFSFTPEGKQSFTGTPQQVVAISPDGTRLAYTADGRIFVRSIGELEARAITDMSKFAVNPVFAPDGESIVFVTLTERGPTLTRVPFSGGPALVLSTLEGTPSFSGISWSRDGILVGAVGTVRGVVRVSPNGGAVERVISLEVGEIVHGPQMLPDGQTVLFTLGRAKNSGDDLWDKAQVVTQSLVDGTRRVVIDGGSDGRYVPTGHLVYAVGGTIYAVPFDPRTLEVTGAAVPVIPGVRRATGGASGTAQLAISETGTLAYLPGPSLTARSLVLGDGKNDPALLRIAPAAYVHPRISPDGRLLAVGRSDGASSDIWTYDLSGKAEIKRLTFGGQSRFPVWSADSRRVTFQSGQDNAIWWQAADGSGPQRLTSPAQGEEHVPEAWSRDGTKLLFSIFKESRYSLWVRTLDGRTERFGQAESAEPLSASLSPDGRWIVYAATDLAGANLSRNRGVFVERFPFTGEKHQAPKILLDYHPTWAPNGRSLFYVPGSNRPIVSVPVTTQPAVAFGPPRELPRGPLPGILSLGFRGYDVLPDGRFVSVSPWSGSGSTGAAAAEIHVVVNWFEELKRLVPTN
jgi:serine/threonine protein kinase